MTDEQLAAHLQNHPKEVEWARKEKCDSCPHAGACAVEPIVRPHVERINRVMGENETVQDRTVRMLREYARNLNVWYGHPENIVSFGISITAQYENGAQSTIEKIVEYKLDETEKKKLDHSAGAVRELVTALKLS